MTKHTLHTIFLTMLSVLAVACGDAGQLADEVDPGTGGQGGAGGAAGEPIEVEDRLAPFDNDSADDPSVDQFLSITGTREIIYSDVISAEDGDTQDFVQFELPNNSNPNQNMGIQIDCDVFGDQNVFARVELMNVDGNDATRINGPPIDCNQGEFRVTVQNDQVQLARIHVQGVPEEQTLIEYTIVVAPF